ncbi:T9SS type A sorting domain-containing protein [Ginsengibacter hankyongi]|uniref:T9SS type A sorting domain-containing protein n=1 Tax=Ginsengibacter hankyongi TaxID=2607284 RepID=A0A5J5IFL1_9BACT|nr:PA14 domain-containing protein [Ginsengibacter hankyongi]KAA9038414.1 T9SS type A sorting domain-containing protein [Ginsengibacter hankyongi]
MRLFIFISALVMSSLFATAQTGVSVLTQHNDINRTGWNNKETILNPANVSSGNFGRIGTFNVDDEVYAQPLVVNNITVGNHTGSVLYTATVNNTVYAFDADDVTDTAYLWKVSLNPSGQRAPNTADLKDAQWGTPCAGNYLDFSGRIGIVGTPVIDTVTNTLYVAAKTIDANGNFYAYLNALDLKTGQQKTGSPHLISAQVNGTGAGSVNGKVAFQAKFQNQRPGLLLYNNVVYVAFASHCDWGPYHGWVLGFDAGTLNFKYAYNTTPDARLGGIWMSGQGITVGPDGNLYVTTGNGVTTPDNTITGSRSSSMIKLSPQLTQLDWFTPANYAYLDSTDGDYGSDGVLIIPNSSTTVSGSKEGISYVIDYNNMGRFDSLNRQVKDTLIWNPNTFGDIHVHGSPVYAQLNGKEFVYGWAESSNLHQFSYDRNTGTFLNAYKQGNRTLDNGMPGAMLSLSSNGADTSSGIVWACFPTSGDANHQVRPGSFAAYKANDVSAGELWNSDQNPNDVIGYFAKFNPPTVANGKVYVPTFSKAIKVYGILPPDTSRCVNNGTGLKAEYFSNTAPTDPFPATATITTTTPTINFNWGTGGPPGISTDFFKARFTGTVQSIDAGTYTFYVTSDDGFRLWINNQLVIDKWIDKSASEDSATITLSKCTKNFIKLEYYENQYDAVCILKWKGPGIIKQVIPAVLLYPPDTTVQCISNGTGLLAEYFSNTASTAPFPATPTVTKTEPTINFSWGTGGPPGISVDSFKARFSGAVQSLDAGTYTFYVTSDDGYRLWVNNQLVLDRWFDKSPSEDSVNVPLAGCTKNSIKLEYYENLYDATCILKWSGPGILKQVIPAIQLYPVDSTKCTSNGTGLLAQYYSNTAPTDPFPATATVTKTEPTINFNWGTGGPPGISIDFFKARFTGTVQTITTGTYTFYVTSDDGFRLWINNQLVIDKWIDKSASEDSVSIPLPGCTKNVIKLEYYENQYDAVCILKWSGPGIAKQVIPAIQLYPADTTIACGDPAGLQSGSITTTSAVVSWTAVSNATSYSVDFKLDSSNTWINAASATIATSVTLSSLQAGSLYDWRVEATCSGGTGNYIAAQFTTLPQSTCNAPSNLSSSSITGSSATVSWGAVSGALSYNVDYSLSGQNSWTSGASATTLTSVTIAGLNSSTTYDWRVRSNCSSTSSSGYTTASFTTLASATCNAPASLNTTSITSSGATVSWGAVSGALSYDMQYGTSGSGPWTTVNTTSTSVNITGLSASAIYYWQVRTNCSSGSSAYTNALQFTTSAAGCTDALEPNNTLATAQSISIGANVNAEIASSTDVDYYVFTTSGSQKNVKVNLTNLPANYNLALYNSKGNQLATSTNGGTSGETLVYNNNKAGTYYVKVYGATSSDYSSTQCYSLQVLTGNTAFTATVAGIIDNTTISNAGLRLYPVPASSDITISFDAAAAGKAIVTIINQLGQEVYRRQVDITSGNNTNNINLSKLVSGVYMLKLQTTESIQSRKLIISK